MFPRVAFVAIPVLCVCSVSAAELSTPIQFNDYALEFSDLTFADTLFHGRIHFEHDPHGNDEVIQYHWTGMRTASNQRVDVFGGAVLQYFYVHPTNGDTIYTIIFPDGEVGAHDFRWDMTPDNTRLRVEQRNDAWALRVRFNSAILVDAHGTAVWQMLLPGDWSSIGTGEGQTEFIGVSGRWTITEFFTFDGDNTVFRCENTDAGAGSPPSVEFILHGSPVPAPATIPALLAPILIRRRR